MTKEQEKEIKELNDEAKKLEIETKLTVEKLNKLFFL